MTDKFLFAEIWIQANFRAILAPLTPKSVRTVADVPNGANCGAQSPRRM